MIVWTSDLLPADNISLRDKKVSESEIFLGFEFPDNLSLKGKKVSVFENLGKHLIEGQFEA